MTKRERIIKAATELFLLKGYHVTTLVDIAKNAGVLPGSMYQYFKTKDSLLVFVLNEIDMSVMTPRLCRLLQDAADVLPVGHKHINRDVFKPHTEYSNAN